MSHSSGKISGSDLLDRVDARQNEVICKLDELNTNIEAVISEWTQLAKQEVESSL